MAEQIIHLPGPDPTMQALIDQSFVSVPMDVSADGIMLFCKHKEEECTICATDFSITNRLSRILSANPSLPFPPASNMITQKLTQMVTAAKEEGNTLFKSGNPAQAIKRYNAAANLAVQRPPWEANQFMREELSTVVSNRSAAFYDMNDYIPALADAEIVIALRRNWSKGHFRKAKSLVGLHCLDEAAGALKLGLAFEPGSNELLTFLAEIEHERLRNGCRKGD